MAICNTFSGILLVVIFTLGSKIWQFFMEILGGGGHPNFSEISVDNSGLTFPY